MELIKYNTLYISQCKKKLKRTFINEFINIWGVVNAF